MSEINHKEILEQWSKIYLRNEYEDWKLEIDPSINQDFASIALFFETFCSAWVIFFRSFM